MTKIIGIAGAILALVMLSTICVAPPVSIPQARDDTFRFNIYDNNGNVLDNDRGQGIKVVTMSDTANGGAVLMQSNGNFCYLPSGCKPDTVMTDSFKYTIQDKSGAQSTANVYIIFKCGKKVIPTGLAELILPY